MIISLVSHLSALLAGNTVIPHTNVTDQMVKIIMSLSKITSKYQVTVPSNVRAILGIKSGDRLEFVIENNQVLLKKPNPIDWIYVQSLEYELSE